MRRYLLGTGRSPSLCVEHNKNQSKANTSLSWTYSKRQYQIFFEKNTPDSTVKRYGDYGAVVYELGYEEKYYFKARK